MVGRKPVLVFVALLSGCAGVHAGCVHEHAKALVDVQRPRGDTAGGSTTVTRWVLAMERVITDGTHGPAMAMRDTLDS